MTQLNNLAQSGGKGLTMAGWDRPGKETPMSYLVDQTRRVSWSLKSYSWLAMGRSSRADTVIQSTDLQTLVICSVIYPRCPMSPCPTRKNLWFQVPPAATEAPTLWRLGPRRPRRLGSRASPWPWLRRSWRMTSFCKPFRSSWIKNYYEWLGGGVTFGGFNSNYCSRHLRWWFQNVETYLWIVYELFKHRKEMIGWDDYYIMFLGLAGNHQPDMYLVDFGWCCLFVCSYLSWNDDVCKIASEQTMAIWIAKENIVVSW